MKNEGPSEELAEVEEELEKKKGDGQEDDDVELGKGEDVAKSSATAEALKVFSQVLQI